jgi:medium-chain acyl-[acyl-carrier-protein] hydrolase
MAPWLVRQDRHGQGRLRLLCFPFAGSGASAFRSWGDGFPEAVEVYGVQLPGRGARRQEAPCREMAPLVGALARLLITRVDKPFAFFGHSLGGLLAFELSRELRRRGGPRPRHLFVSAVGAPHVPEQRTPIHALPKRDLLTRLRALSGTPAEVLAHQDLMETLLPTFRADLALFETYRCAEEPPLDVPIGVFGGLQDPFVSRDRLLRWRDQTHSRFAVRMLPGEHFFLNTARSQLLTLLRRELDSALGAEPPA